MTRSCLDINWPTRAGKRYLFTPLSSSSPSSIQPPLPPPTPRPTPYPNPQSLCDSTLARFTTHSGFDDCKVGRREHLGEEIKANLKVMTSFPRTLLRLSCRTLASVCRPSLPLLSPRPLRALLVGGGGGEGGARFSFIPSSVFSDSGSSSDPER